MRGWTPTSPPVGKSSSEARSSPSTAPKRRGRCKSWLMTPSRPSTGFRDDVRGPRRDAPAPDAGGDGQLRHPHQHLRGACIRGNGQRRVRVPALEEHRERQEYLGTYLPQTTGQDRGRDPKVALARFAQTLGTLSAARVPILQAIVITATSSGNWVVKNALLKIRDAIRQASRSTSHS